MFLEQLVSVEISVTRRSGGLPRAIIAVISGISESKLRRELVDSTIAFCVEVVGDLVVRDEKVDLPQVHALNVMRGLIEDGGLTRLTRDHIGASLELCITQFSAACFPIRNCAAMFFAVLIKKAFGISKSLVGSSEFFTKFPGVLRDVLLRELGEAVDGIKSGIVRPSLYPILSILSRIRGEGESMRDFENLVLDCGRSCHWKVREVSARCLAGLVCLERMPTCLSESAARLEVGRGLNHTHGVALQIAAFVESCIIDDSLTTELVAEFSSVLVRVEWIFRVDGVGCGVLLEAVRKLYFDLDYTINLDLGNLVRDTCLEMLNGKRILKFSPPSHLDTAAQIYYHHSIHQGLNLQTVQTSKCQLSVLRALSKQDLALIFREPFTASIKTTLDICVSILQLKECDSALLTISAQMLTLTSPAVYGDIADVLAIWFGRIRIQFDLLEALLYLITSQIEYQEDKTLLWALFYDKCKLYITPTKPLRIRLAIGSCLATLLTVINLAPNTKIYFEYCVLIDLLVGDDNFDVRSQAVQLIAKMMKVFFIELTP